LTTNLTLFGNLPFALKKGEKRKKFLTTKFYRKPAYQTDAVIMSAPAVAGAAPTAAGKSLEIVFEFPHTWEIPRLTLPHSNHFH